MPCCSSAFCTRQHGPTFHTVEHRWSLTAMRTTILHDVAPATSSAPHPVRNRESRVAPSPAAPARNHPRARSPAPPVSHVRNDRAASLTSHGLLGGRGKQLTRRTILPSRRQPACEHELHHAIGFSCNTTATGFANATRFGSRAIEISACVALQALSLSFDNERMDLSGVEQGPCV